MIQLVPKKAIIVSDSMSIDGCIRLMIEKKFSSVLVHNDDKKIVGIMTERDILRKISILDIERKLEHKVAAIMSRKVYFVRPDYLLEDIRSLHQKHKLRHFPISKKQDEVSISDIVGFISTTDVARAYLNLL